MTKLDLTKPVQTRSGTLVEIITAKSHSKEYPILGYIGDGICIEEWRIDGSYSDVGASEYDLINVPDKKYLYLNIYSDTASPV